MNRESFAIRLSAATNVLLGVLGIGFGVYVSSDAILLDGLFNWVSFVMALLTLRVAKMVARPDDEKFHFGYAYFEPLINAVKALIVLGVGILALVGAIEALAHGGRALDPGPALLYAGIAVAGCLLLAVLQRRLAKTTGSPLVEVDAKNWFVNGAISAAVAVAFLVALLAQGTSWEWIVPYVDPVLVCALVVLTLPIPVKMALQGIGEMLHVAPEPAEQQRVRARFDAAVSAYDFEKTMLRMVRVGRYFYLMIHVVLPASFPLTGVGDLDRMRDELKDELRDLHPALVTDIVFIGDERWAYASVGT
jgi:cation diffusion facilitator family transporter